jgi:hypothetical protein
MYIESCVPDSPEKIIYLAAKIVRMGYVHEISHLVSAGDW